MPVLGVQVVFKLNCRRIVVDLKNSEFFYQGVHGLFPDSESKGNFAVTQEHRKYFHCTYKHRKICFLHST